MKIREISKQTKDLMKQSYVKGMINLYLIPFVVLFITDSTISSLAWILFVSVIYIFFRKNTNNGKVFFELMGISALTVLGFILIVLVFSIS